MPTLRANVATGAASPNEDWTADQRTEIVAEAERVLADPAFRNSKRCITLLRYLLDRALAGDDGNVKERTLGVEVFGRALDYDTAADPVVRVTANEIRKRLAQWYQESDNRRQVRIRLPAGSYLLTFEFAPDSSPERPSPDSDEETLRHAEPTAVATSSPVEPPTAKVVAATNSWANKWPAVLAAFVLALVTFVAISHFGVFQSTAELAWKPVLGSSSPVTLCLPDVSAPGTTGSSTAGTAASDAGAKGVDATTGDIRTFTPVAYAVVSQNITDWLAMHHQKSDLRGASAVSLQELRQGPVVLIGGFNPWAQRLTSKLRFSVQADPANHSMWIQDAQNISARQWAVDGGDHPKDVDYAVISRFINPDTGNWVLSLSGLREQGTEAAKDLLVDGAYEKLLPSRIGSKGNFQIVVKTNIINGCAGPPQVLAAETW